MARSKRKKGSEIDAVLGGEAPAKRVEAASVFDPSGLSRRPDPAENRERLAALFAVRQAGFGLWGTARSVLTPVRAVPTRFIQLDFGTRVWGYPIERPTVIHGPSNHGKTEAALGLGLSFLERNHLFFYVDAEFTTPEDWLGSLMGEYHDHPGFYALRPTSYEQAVDAIREAAKMVAKLRDSGRLPPDTSALIVVDSIRRLVPADFLKKIEKHGAEGQKGSVDGMGGRGAQLMAKMNSDWMAELIPLLYSTKTGLLLIGRESVDPAADQYDRLAERDWKLTGGSALIFDSSLVSRVTRDGWVYRGSEGDREVIGERKKVRIWKTKVGGKLDGKHTDCFFHTSNGVMIPAGYDRARDLIEIGARFGILELSGSWVRWGDKAWNGVNAAVLALHADHDALDEIDLQVRRLFTEQAPLDDAEAEQEQAAEEEAQAAAEEVIATPGRRRGRK